MNLATWLVILVVLPIAIAIVAVPSLRGALGRVLRQPAFLGAFILLGVAAVGLNAATQAMRLHFRKLPVELSVPRLDDVQQGIPAQLGNWVQVSKDEPLDHATQEVLGTKEFIFRDYVDSRVVTPEEIAWFTDKSGDDRRTRVAEIQAAHPEAAIKVAITYYTGGVDTVPHVPEKCYVADGFVPKSEPATREETLGTNADGSPRQIKYRHIHFQDATPASRLDRDVAYLFHVNGKYESSNLGVRKELANLFQTYGYFAKVELMTTAQGRTASAAGVNDSAQAKSLAAFNDLLTAMLPEVERCLPDWKKVISKGKS